MDSDKAKHLIQNYIEGWKQNNAQKIVRQLARNCLIIESHGPTYHGVNDVKSWVDTWIKGGYKVDKWDIVSFNQFEDKCVFEWIFEFSSSKTEKRTIEGITTATFKAGKINFLREYRTTKPPYNWGEIKKLDAF